MQRGSGARGLHGVLEGLLKQVRYDLASLSGVERCRVIDAAVRKLEAGLINDSGSDTGQAAQPDFSGTVIATIVPVPIISLDT
jgi:ATP-dependent protease Clp ATPase subunit